MTDGLMVRLAAHGHPEVRAAHGAVFERVPDPADGRAKLVRATDRGREVYAIARDAMLEVQERLDARLGAERMATLRTLLQEVGDELAPRVPATE